MGEPRGQSWRAAHAASPPISFPKRPFQHSTTRPGRYAFVWHHEKTRILAVMALATPLTAPPPTLPWYRVIPQFAWLTQPKKPKRLRPAGHSAWVEAMQQPVLFAISLAFMSAGLYTLAKDYVVKAVTAIHGGDYS